MAIFSLRAVQGSAESWTVTASSGAFQGTEPLTAVVSTGGTAAALLTLTPTWAAGQQPGSYRAVVVSITGQQAASLSPGYYVCEAKIADGSTSLAWGLLEIVAAPGGTPTQDFLVSPAEVLGLVPDIATPDKLADLPRTIGAATDAVRKYCRCNFTRKTYGKEFAPNYAGMIRLDEVPVNAVLRVATNREAALWLYGPPSAQIANVRFSATGDYAGGLTYTGLVLTSTTSAVATTTTLLFSAYPTVSELASAVNAAGWKTRVGDTFGAWPSTELVGGEAGQGALTGEGARLDVYSEDASLERVDLEAGFIWLANRTAST